MWVQIFNHLFSWPKFISPVLEGQVVVFIQGFQFLSLMFNQKVALFILHRLKQAIERKKYEKIFCKEEKAPGLPSL